MPPRLRHPHLAFAPSLLLAVVLAIGGAFAQTAPIKIVVPFPPGGGADILARLLAEQISRQSAAVVENRPGAGSAIGTEAVARAAPDGMTLLINTPNLLIGPYLHKLAYDPLTSFAPVCDLVNSPTAIVVNARSPYRTLANLVAAARAAPGVLSIATVGPATTLHIAAETLKRRAEIDLIYVPFGGTAPAVTALLGGHVTAVFAEYPAVAEQLAAGRLRALATGSPIRIAPLPDLPTVAESGFAGYGVELWWGLFAPAGTPNEVVSRLAGVFTAALQAPGMAAKLSAGGFDAVGRCGAAFGRELARQNDDYGRAIRAIGLKGE